MERHPEPEPAPSPADEEFGVAQEFGPDAEPYPADEPDLAGLTEMVVGLQRDFDSFLPHLIGALERDKAFDEISERLRKAEASAAVALNWALIDGVHRLLNDARKLDGLEDEVRAVFVRQLAGMLRAAGVTEFGRRGEEFDAVRHEPIEARGDGAHFRVRSVRASGLERAGVVLKRAKVIIERTSAEELSTQVPST
jgi:hypothetical protein